MRRQPLITAVVSVELLILAALGWRWITQEPENPFLPHAYLLQAWVPYAALGYGVLTLLALARWIASLIAADGRARRGLGLLVIVLLAFGGYAFWQFYGEIPVYTRFAHPVP